MPSTDTTTLARAAVVPVDLSDLDQPLAPTEPGADLDPMAREMALSMYYGDTDYTDDQISEATGLTTGQIRDLVNACEDSFSHIPTDDQSPTPAPTAVVPVLAAGPSVEELLVWGEQHAAKGVQALAARVRTALADLAVRYSTDRAVTAAESQVETLRQQLARAEQELRDVKAGKTVPTATATATAPVAVAVAAVPDGERLEQPADKETRRRIRAWARTQGLYPADKGDRGLISQEILRAWTQHSTTGPLARAS